MKVDVKSFCFISKKTRMKKIYWSLLLNFDKNKIELCIKENCGTKNISDEVYELDMVDFYLIRENKPTVYQYLVFFQEAIESCLTANFKDLNLAYKSTYQKYDILIKDLFSYRKSITIKSFSFFIWFKTLFNSNV